MQLPPTFEDVSRVVKLLSRLPTKIKLRADGYKNAGQRRAAMLLCKYDQTVLQMYRRSGKSYIVAVIAAIYIICGETVIIGAPTQGQSSRIIFAEITGIVDILFGLLGMKKFIDRRSLTYNVWLNGGTLIALTANIASKQQEGYGGAFLILDEGQRLDPAILAVMTPCIDDAMETGIGKVTVLGVGGLKASLIEYLKKKLGWLCYKYKASDETIASKQETFRKQRDAIPSFQYDAHYECKSVKEGQRFMHSRISGEIDVTDCIAKGQRPVLYFGIDVGKVKDSTVVKVLSTVNKLVRNELKLIINEIDSFEVPGAGVDYEIQADEVYHWIDTNFYWRPERIVIELNGVGGPFYDMLCKRFKKRLGGITTGAENKKQFWNELCMSISDGCFGVKNDEAREHYESMVYEVGIKDGKIDFEHSDYWMALMMAWLARQQATVL